MEKVAYRFPLGDDGFNELNDRRTLFIGTKDELLKIVKELKKEGYTNNLTEWPKAIQRKDLPYPVYHALLVIEQGKAFVDNSFTALNAYDALACLFVCNNLQPSVTLEVHDALKSRNARDHYNTLGKFIANQGYYYASPDNARVVMQDQPINRW